MGRGSAVRRIGVTAIVALLAGAGAIAAPLFASSGEEVRAATSELRNAHGDVVGVVRLDEEHGKVRLRADLARLPAGFHGFHVHAVGACEAPTFTSAGGHLNPAGEAHPEHAGDMPVLLVNTDGTAFARFETDRFAVADLLDHDGSAIIVHTMPDNYGNIPSDRYHPKPDATTLATGDAGGRIACGVVAAR